MNNNQNVAQPITFVQFIHWTLFSFVFIYGGLAFGLSRMFDGPIVNSLFFLRTFGIILGIVSVLQIAFVLFVRKFWLSPESLAEVDENDEPEERYFKAIIVQNALLESLGIYGLVLSMLSDWFLMFLPFAITTLVLMIVFRPSKSDFEGRLERAGFNRSSREETKTGR